MKALIVFNHPAPYKIRLFNELAKSIDLTVIFERSSAKNRNRLFYQQNEIRFNCIFLKGLYIGDENHLSLEVIKNIRQNHYDLIIINGYSTFTEMLTIHYLQRKNQPYALYVNGGVIRNDNFIKKMVKESLISNAAFYMSPSKEADEYLMHYGAIPDCIYDYPYSTIYEREIAKAIPTREEKQEIRNELGIAGNFVAVSSGQFIERKNYLELLKIWKSQPEDCQLILVGDGQETEKYKDFILQNEMTNVLLLPFMIPEKLFRIFRASDVFILLSKEDIYGHVINEAMSQGLPVISSDRVVAAQHLIVEGVNGYLVDYHNEGQIISRIEDAKHFHFGDAPLKTAKENTIEKMAENHIGIFKEATK